METNGPGERSTGFFFFSTIFHGIEIGTGVKTGYSLVVVVVILFAALCTLDYVVFFSSVRRGAAGRVSIAFLFFPRNKLSRPVSDSERSFKYVLFFHRACFVRCCRARIPPRARFDRNTRRRPRLRRPRLLARARFNRLRRCRYYCCTIGTDLRWWW